MSAQALAESSHEKLANRLVGILCLLNEGRLLVPKELADDFNVTLRTIQRDIARFGRLGLHKVDGGYQLKHRLGKTTVQDMERFASLAGIDGLFPTLRQALAQAGQAPIREALLVKGNAYEDIGPLRQAFQQLECAIVDCHRVSFRLQGTAPEKVYSGVEPYRMLNQKGIWYLVARHGGRSKTFSFTRISGLLVSEDPFVRDPTIVKRLEEEDGIWFQDEPREVTLEVDAPVARYFRRRKLVANQVIVEDRADGSLLLKARIGHDNQVLPIVRYWIPHVRIVEPASMQRAMEEKLRVYIGPALSPSTDSFDRTTAAQ